MIALRGQYVGGTVRLDRAVPDREGQAAIVTFEDDTDDPAIAFQKHFDLMLQNLKKMIHEDEVDLDIEKIRRLYHLLLPLSPPRLDVILEYVEHLSDKESQEETDELMAIPGFKEDLAEAERDIAEGRLTPASEVKWKF